MRWRSVKDLNCSVARTLAVVGERWTMLILRDAFLGRRRFDEFQRSTGIARNILATRLRALVRDGIFERSTASEGRVEYRLTRKGMELYPVMAAMLKWGDTWLCDEKGPPLTLVHRPCGARTTPSMTCSHCGGLLNPREMLAMPRRTAHARRTSARRRAAR
jgi:DNA-binding HxlR family transcriptional regulator